MKIYQNLLLLICVFMYFCSILSICFPSKIITEKEKRKMYEWKEIHLPLDSRVYKVTHALSNAYIRICAHYLVEYLQTIFNLVIVCKLKREAY